MRAPSRAPDSHNTGASPESSAKTGFGGDPAADSALVGAAAEAAAFGVSAVPEASALTEANRSLRAVAWIKAKAEWLAEFEMLAAFNGAAIGVVGCVAGALTSDGMLMFVAGVGASACASIWAHQLDLEIRT